MLVSTDEFLTLHPLVPTVAKADAEIVILKASIAEIATLAAEQDAGRAAWSGASDEREYLRGKLKDQLSEISVVSKALDPETYPTARAQFKMTVNGSFASYVTRGHAFLTAIGPIKAAFVEHGLAADFDEALSDAIAALEEAGASTYNGRQAQMAGTAGMKLALKRGVRAVRVLDSIVAPKLKKTDPALLVVWKAVTRIERPPKKTAEAGSGGGGGAGSPSVTPVVG
jgi:hypothetical protein